MRLAAPNGGPTFVEFPLYHQRLLLSANTFPNSRGRPFAYFMLIYSAALCTHRDANSKAVLTAACSHKNSIKIYENCAVSNGRPIKPRRHTREPRDQSPETSTAASFATIRYRWRPHNNTCGTTLRLLRQVVGLQLFALVDLLKRARASWSSVLGELFQLMSPDLGPAHATYQTPDTRATASLHFAQHLITLRHSAYAPWASRWVNWQQHNLFHTAL